jgi:hypothetical protein
MAIPRLKRPTNQTSAVLWLFIRKRTWTRWKIEEWTGSSYPPARIADLRKAGIVFSDIFKTGVNKFGHTFNYRVWTMETPAPEAIKIYNNINGAAYSSTNRKPGNDDDERYEEFDLANLVRASVLLKDIEAKQGKAKG